MSMNDLQGLTHAKKLIKENLETKATFLDLGNCGLSDLSELPELWKCQHLEGLNMGSYFSYGEKWIGSKNAFGLNEIGSEGAMAIAVNLAHLTSLDLRSNQIGSEGAKSIAENLGQLTSLNLWYNNIGSEGARAIAENLAHLTSLDLRSNQIGSEGARAIAENLGQLTSLDLGWNQIGSEGARAIAENLGQLTSLILVENQIGDEGAKVIGKNSKSLTFLNLGGNQIGYEGAKVIAENCKGLTFLDLSRNPIGDEGAKVIAENCKSLTSLDLGFIEIGDEGAKVIAENCKSLTSLDLSLNQIGDEGAKVIGENCKSLTSLDLEGNQIGDEGAKAISENLGQLTSLNLANNQIGDEGIEIIVSHLKNLIIIDLSENKTKRTLPEILNNINSLREYFGVSKEEIVAIKVQRIPNNTIKLLLVGNSTSGKTTLANYLSTAEYTQDYDSTHGVKTWIWRPEIEGQKYKVNIRDFGGQDYFHAIHPMFFDSESLFLLLHCNDALHQKECHEGNQYHSTNYWLGNIEDILLDKQEVDTNKFAVWYVQNKSDHAEYRKQWLPTPRFSDYVSVEQQFFISILIASKNKSKPPIEWKHFIENLYEKIISLCTTEINEWWAKIRDEALPEWRKNNQLYFTRNEFSTSCKEFLNKKNIPYITENESFNGILDYLYKTGEVIWFKNKPKLKDYVFLGADKLTHDLFEKVLDKEAKNNHGIIELTNYDEDVKILVEILKVYGLIFEDPKGTGKYIAPQFLPEELHISRFTQLMPLCFALRFSDYLPRYLITRFITKFSLEGEEAHYWRYGVMFKMNGVLFLIQADVNSQIISIHSEDKKEKYSVLKDIYNFFSNKKKDHRDFKILDNIEEESAEEFLENIKNLDFKKKNNPIFKSNFDLSLNGRQFISIQNWQNAINSRASKAVSSQGEFVDIRATIYQILGEGNFRPKRVFLSYAHADENHLSQLKAHLTGPEMSGLIDVWHDRKIDGGQLWDDVIRSELKNADIVLLLLSHNFMKSRYIWETEIPVAKDAGATIVPIFLSPVYFKESVHNIYTHQGFPNDTKWILGESWRNINEAYMAVVEGLVKLLEA